MIGGQVGFASHITVADGVKIAAQSGVTKSITEPHSIWQGTPAQPIKAYQSQQIALRNLIRALVLDRIEALEQKQPWACRKQYSNERLNSVEFSGIGLHTGGPQ